MPTIKLFTDGSVDNHSRIGYGARLFVRDDTVPLHDLKTMVTTKRFEQTSSTKLELQTLLWALNELLDTGLAPGQIVTVYTDSQNIIGLPARRARLERNSYYSSKNRRLANFDLYQAFYRITDCLACEWVKVVGHKPTHTKDRIDQLFNLVDRAARRAHSI